MRSLADFAGVQTFKYRQSSLDSRGRSPALDGSGSEIGGLPHALPFRGGLGGAPAKVADRRRGKRDAPVDRQPVFGRSLHHSALDLDRRGLLREARYGGKHRKHHYQKSSVPHKPSFGFGDLVTQQWKHFLRISLSQLPVACRSEMQMVWTAGATF